MNAGKAFEIFVKNILMCVGFSEVSSDGLYIYDGAAGQMIQGLGEAHNADVLLEPPVQTPFYSLSRLLVECKDYNRKIGLNTMRSALGLKEDVNRFDIVDLHELQERRRTRRSDLVYCYNRYFYQVAVASLSGFTIPAQKFAATYRIPLIEFDKMPFWNDVRQILQDCSCFGILARHQQCVVPDHEIERRIANLANRIGRSMAIALTNSGQLLFLYKTNGEHPHFSDYYSIHWGEPKDIWRLSFDEDIYTFQLPSNILKIWIENSQNELDLKRNAINCKAEFFSNMVIYYIEGGKPNIKMVSINRDALDSAKRDLGL